MKKLEVRKNTYYDSVTLMIISKEVKTVDGVNEALVGMGTDLNQELVKNLHLAAPGFEEVKIGRASCRERVSSPV